MTGNLFDTFAPAPSSWSPPTPPPLTNVDAIELDCETDGLRWWEKHRPIGIGVCLPNQKTYYLPWGHRGGGNLDEEIVKRWAQQELRGKHITNLNTRFDIHMLREWGVDLEAQGCTVSDVGHYAALLDDHRQHFSLESIVADYLPDEAKVKEVGGIVIDPTRMADYHAGFVAVRAEGDVRQVHKLRKLMWPLLDAQDLQRVRQLEDDVIYVVCEMEKNGALLDLELLKKWVEETEKQRVRSLMQLAGMVGKLIDPSRHEDMVWLFNHCGLENQARTATGRASFSGSVLTRANHPAVELALHASRLATLRSKYLLKYQATVDPEGRLRYALHQLRAQRDSFDQSRGAGTVSGRFSSTEITAGVGVNIQQVMKPEKQAALYGPDFTVRQLFRPESGLYLSADAMQIEYRIFAHHASTPSVMAAYEEDPYLSFHKLVWEMVKKHKPEIRYRQQKDLNFAKIYGAGAVKMAMMLEFITVEEGERLYRQKARWDHPSLRTTKEVNEIYNRMLPEVEPLLHRASDLARSRGYVRTLLGRRMRFPGQQRLHKALNGVIQGTAADIMKLKLVELHRERNYTGFRLRFTVHDEVDGDIPDKQSALRVKEVLQAQSVPLKIPILWEVGIGTNWAAVEPV